MIDKSKLVKCGGCGECGVGFGGEMHCFEEGRKDRGVGLKG